MDNTIFPKEFKQDNKKAYANPECIIKGFNYRITVLTERLVRLEYNTSNIFFDDLTNQVSNRVFPKPLFTLKEDDKFLQIETKYFMLNYQKEKPFEGVNIEIQLKNSDSFWTPKKVEARNFYTSGLGFKEDKALFAKGLYSRDGYVTLDDSKSLIVDPEGFLVPPSVNRTDLYIFLYNNDFGKCLQDYFMLTGSPLMIPRYALGVWWNKEEIYNFDDINDLVYKFNKEELPLSILLLSEFWHLKDAKDLTLYKTGYTFNRNLFSDPAYFARYLHERSIHLGLDINPSEGIYPFEDKYNEIASKLSLTNKSVIPFNIYDKNIVSLYFSHLIKPLREKGVDFFFLDYYPNDNNTLSALTKYHKDIYKSNGSVRGFVMAPNHLIASHKDQILYSGHTKVSWETLASIPYFNSYAANKGLSFWSHDVGGFENGVEDAELYTRYVELATFSPIFRFASKGGKYYKREPWRWGVKTLSIVREYTRLRHRLIPYLYTESYIYHKVGLPLIRPIFYDEPGIVDEPKYKNEYLFGSELLVAPITTSKDVLMDRTLHRLYIPKGVWYDFKTGKKFLGDRRYVAFYKDEDYPVFARQGSIIPLANFRNNINDTSSPDSLEIHIFPGKSNTYNLYEDDGVSDLYQNGNYLVTSIDYNYLSNNFTVIIRPVEGRSNIIPDKRDYTIRFRNTRKADDVIVYVDKEQVDSVSFEDDNDFVVAVKEVPTTCQLTVNCKGKDIEIDAARLINEDIESIIEDLAIKTNLKERLSSIMFDKELPISKKRILIRKEKSYGLDSKYVKMFLKLLEYEHEVEK